MSDQMLPEYKRCPKCGERKEAVLFRICDFSSDGLSLWCRKCARTYFRERYHRQKEEGTYKPASPEKNREYCRVYYQRKKLLAKEGTC